MSGRQVQNMMIDKKEFGKRLRFLRRGRGINNTKDYAKVIYEKTGYKVHYNTLNRIESGKAAPSLQTLMAISLTLFGEVLADEIRDITKMSVDGNETIDTV